MFGGDEPTREVELLPEGKVYNQVCSSQSYPVCVDSET